MFAGLQRLQQQGFAPSALVDVGAYEGDFARLCRGLWPECFILMIEAQSSRCGALERTALDIGNAEVEIALVGSERAAAVPFHIVHAGTAADPVNTGSSVYRELTGYAQQVSLMPQSTLDDILCRRDRRFTFLKLDIQGGEIDALRGGAAYLHNIAVILMEISIVRYNEGAPIFHQVIDYMRTIGFFLLDIVDQHRVDDKLFQIDCLFSRDDYPARLRFHPNWA